MNRPAKQVRDQRWLNQYLMNRDLARIHGSVCYVRQSGKPKEPRRGPTVLDGFTSDSTHGPVGRFFVFLNSVSLLTSRGLCDASAGTETRLAGVKTPRWAIGVIVLMTWFAGLTGCLRRPAAVSAGTYHLVNIGSVTILQSPSGGQAQADQWVSTITLPGPPGVKSLASGKDCSIHTKLFAFAPSETPNRWIVKSPSAENWTVVSTQDELAPEWIQFLADLTKIERLGCFPSKETTYSVQRSIVAAIPIPAEQSLLFFYSLSGSGYVDLQPGLEIRVEWPARLESKADSGEDLFSLYKVRPRSQTGVELELYRESKQSAKHSASYADLPQIFASYPLLRLFLQQGATDTSAPREATLLGALTGESLTRASEEVLRNASDPCRTALPTVGCLSFSRGGVSVLSAVTINGRKALYGPGTTLGQLLDALPDRAKASALATVSVQRPWNSGYAGLVFQRDIEAASKVILINGDRIRWAE